MKGWSSAIVLWGVLLALVAPSLWFPNSHWMTFSRLFIHDAEVGTVPTVNMDVNFYRKFVVHWHSVVRQAKSNVGGDFIGVCETDDQAEVSPYRKFPPKIDLDWWMNPKICNLGVGSYYVETVFSWSPLIGTRTLVVQSNPFKILPKG